MRHAGRDDRGSGPQDRPGRFAFCLAQLARAGERASRAAGRSRGRCISSACWSARWGPKAAPAPTPGASSARSYSIIPPAQNVWNELHFPREYPLGHYEMSFLLAAFLERRARQDRRLFHARFQPGVDLSGWFQLGRGPARRIENRPAHRAHADLERNGLLCRPGAADGAGVRTARSQQLRDPQRHLDRFSPTRSARGQESVRGSRCSSPTRPIRAGSGRRTNSGSSSAGRSMPTGSLAFANTLKALTGRAKKSPSTNITATFSSACRACPRPPRPRGSIRWLTCASSARSRW